MKSKNLTLDDIAKEIGYKFFRRVHLGKNETQILDDIEKENNIKLERQYPVLNFYIDGYDSTNNIVYEVDESHHKYQQIQDIIRKNKIKEELGCEFVRIKEEEFLNVKRNKN